MPLGLDSLKGGPWIETFQWERPKVPGVERPAFDWRLFGANGELVCSSHQDFTERNDAEEAAYRAVELMTTPNLEVRSV